MKHIQNFQSFINEALNTSINPNSKLQSNTGFPFAAFYLSNQIKNIMIDFEDPNHILLINLLADQERALEKNNSLTASEISKGKSLFKKVLGETVSYDKYNGADCSLRLSSIPAIDFNISGGKQKWITAIELEKSI